MDKLMNLEDHVIENILGYDDISFDDIVNFRLLWNEFHLRPTVVTWKRVFFQRWPSAKKFYDEQRENEERYDESKHNYENIFIETGIECARQLKNVVSKIIERSKKSIYTEIKFLRNDSLLKDIFKDIYEIILSDENLKNEFDDITHNPERNMKYCFFVDEIKTLLQQYSQKPNRDLTERYWYEKVLNYLITQRLC